MFGKKTETQEEVEKHNPSNDDALGNSTGLTGAAALTVRQSIYPITLVTILFFLWGFAYGLLDVLNAKFQTALNITAAEAGGLQGSYFGAYFIGPLTYSGWIVRALMFWPSAVYRSFPGFCGSLFIVGSGLSTLETSANPFIATCGPPRLSEFRLELSQAFQAVGSVAAPLLASRVFFKEGDGEDLSKVQWTYLGIAGFVFLLAVVFFFSKLPEVTDADMELQAESSAGLTGYEEKPMRKQYKLIFGVAAQFCYVGAQVGVAANFIKFAAAGLMMVVKPRFVLMLFMTAIMIFISIAIGVKGEGGVAMLCLVLFFESCIFPTIFALAIRGLGRHTKRDKKGYHIAMTVPLIGFFVAFAFPIYLNTVCAKELDGFRETKIGYEDADLEAEKRPQDIMWEEKGATGSDAHHFEVETSSDGEQKKE
ncbi:hypothetical protein DID88_000699 [Monilinia fructigena]|uniref:Major facilitator superfamily (MFS) profile domain-containing protein n=1 Tax=Monilinia fructigena TaxID=38457 RepID=A0A395IL23_9HELO|nr:hypothetical protein DID88_000699 [Monilinia fructigena]